MNVLFAVGLGLTLLLTGCFAKVQTLPAQTDSPLFAPLPGSRRSYWIGRFRRRKPRRDIRRRRT